MNAQFLTAAMDNTLAARLGEICREAASDKHPAGDLIDRGLILRRLLEEGGFRLSIIQVEAKEAKA